MSAVEDAAQPTKGTMRFRRTQSVRIDPDKARRQGEITQVAFLVLGRDAAIAFLNTDHDALGGRPLDLAMASDDGRNSVEAEIGRIGYAAPPSAGSA